MGAERVGHGDHGVARAKELYAGGTEVAGRRRGAGAPGALGIEREERERRGGR
jgi:hypothetical protein